MTPLEQLLKAGLSQEEATLILARRAAAEQAPPGSKLTLARMAMEKAQKKVGVHPVVVEGGWIEKEHDPEAEEGFLKFYSNKDEGRPKRKVSFIPKPLEDQSQDPEDQEC